MWLDGVRISNSELSKYSPADIGHYSSSRLTRTAKNYGNHVYQTNIYTVDWVNKHNEEIEANDAHWVMPNRQVH